MADFLTKETATVGVIGRLRNSEVHLNEVVVQGLWSFQPNRNQDLDSIAELLFTDSTGAVTMLNDKALRLFKLWPHKAYLLSAGSSPPGSLADLAGVMTDISHGFCELSLTGTAAFEFLNSYTSVELNNSRITITRCLRCRLGHYQVILWWDDIDEIHMLVDRSYTQSFCDYLETLSLRWSR
jgi:sarcosine oxidase gamma subunit